MHSQKQDRISMTCHDVAAVDPKSILHKYLQWVTNMDGQ